MDFIINNALPFVLQALHNTPAAVDAIETLWRSLTTNLPNYHNAHLIVTIAISQARNLPKPSPTPAA